MHSLKHMQLTAKKKQFSHKIYLNKVDFDLQF